MTAESAKPPASRRTFLAGTGVAAAGTAAAALLGGPLARTAKAAGPVSPPGQFAPVPKRALGPPVNADGYFVGQIKGDLYWVTDSFYTAMFLTTQDGVVLIDAPPTIGHNLLRAIQEVTDTTGTTSRVTHLIYSHNHADHIGAAALFGDKVERIGQTQTRELLRVAADPNRPAPTLTFDDTLTLHVGDHTFNIIHMPGHTAPQTSVHVPEEGVVFTGDNVFHKCRTWMQECDPWEWLTALDRIAALDVETILPGHGEPCGKAYLKEQAQIVENWVGFVETQVDRGVGPEEILKGPVPVTRQDPYPIGQRLFVHDERLTGMIVHNLHSRILARKTA